MSTGAYTTWFVYYIYYMAYIYAFTKICPSGHESWRMTCNIYTTHFVYYIYDSSIFRMKTFSSYKFYMYTIPDLYLLVRRRGFSWSEESIHSPPSRTKCAMCDDVLILIMWILSSAKSQRKVRERGTWRKLFFEVAFSIW